MKIGIITFHFPYNCGATLQCTALQTKLQQMGHQVSVINYRPWYHQNRYVALKNPVYYAGKMMKKQGEDDPLFKRLYRGADGFLRVCIRGVTIRKLAPETHVLRNSFGIILIRPACTARWIS